ncbi:MAG: heme NO-binding domain-containing protein [Micropruina sp.]
MKGVVFTEFLQMVEESYSDALVEELLDSADLPSGGVYTSVGTYDAAEMTALVSRLSELVDVPVPDLLHAFGRWLFDSFLRRYPGFFDGITSTREFLPHVNEYVHLEVRKLYPDAELPDLSCVVVPDGVEMTYRSARNLPDLAEGLIQGCADHYHESVEVSRTPLEGEPPGTLLRVLVSPVA